MQTFLPYPDFYQTFRTLDWRRLGKQRVEAFQLLVANGDSWAIIERAKRGITGPIKRGWVNHPAAIMWRGYEEALSVYMNLCIVAWRERGFKNTMSIRPYLYNEFFSMKDYANMVEMPPWLGDPDFHASHRSNLLRKDPVYYSNFCWTEKPDLPYVWPK